MLAERMTQWTQDWENRGIQKGRADMLRQQVLKRFGNLFDIRFQERLRHATPQQLERWANNILDAKTIDEVFDDES